MELEADGHPWCHPWDHYPFIEDDQCLWLAWRDLDEDQRGQVRRALVQIERRAGALAASREFA